MVPTVTPAPSAEVIRGPGIALLPTWLVGREVQSGRLTEKVQRTRDKHHDLHHVEGCVERVAVGLPGEERGARNKV